MICHGPVVETCWKFNGTGVVREANPTVRHDEGAMTHWNDEPILIGGYGNEIETYDGVQWQRQEDFPSPDPDWTYIEYHSAVNFHGDVYVFGGGPSWIYQGIGAFKFNGSWTKLQNLAGFRHGHRKS